MIQIVKIIRVIDECKDVKSILFKLDKSLIPKPGQFIMIWIPGIDEIPMSISDYKKDEYWGITVKIIGECTKALANLEEGDYIGVRGPLGNSFKIPEDKDKKIFLIGGGIGLAPLRFLSSELKKYGYSFKMIIGAKKENELVLVHKPDNIEISYIHYCTDDGSYGQKGFTIEIFKEIISSFSLDELKNTIVYTCGPEIMMLKLSEICIKKDITLYASLERIMRCGCGLCGLCALDPLGLLVCKDGPIFKSEELKKIKDFGKNKRDFSGRKINLN